MCIHLNFESQVIVTRLTSQDDPNTITGYRAEVRIRCVECNLPFEWIGVPGGYSPTYPTSSIDCMELRAPVQPSTDPVDHVNVLLK